MENWWHGGPNDVAGFVASLLSGEAPKAYRLVDKRAESTSRFETSFVATRRRDSGTLEVSVTPEFRANIKEEAIAERPLIAFLRNAAREEDQRTIEPFLETSSFVSAEFVTSIDQTNESPIPVVGPGGRAVCYRTSIGGFKGEIVIRRRGTDLPGEWREPPEILRRVREVSSVVQKATISASFGYFELSKYELQMVMRPAIIFVLDGYGAAAHSPTWRHTIVEPATYSADISDDDGLGSWSE